MPASGAASPAASEPIVAPKAPTPIAAAASESGHVLALDGLRGVAILAVMMFHFNAVGIDHIHFGDDAVGPIGLALLKFSLLGRQGVDLFFVLSGYLITSNLLRARGRPGYFRVFYWRRFLRIFPAYYVWLTVLMLVIARFYPSEEAGTDPHWRWWLGSYLSNRLIASRGWDSVPLILNHFWSLAVEEQFYLFWPLLIFVLSARRAVWACLVFLIGCLALRMVLVIHGNVAAAYVLTEARMDALAAGSLLAIIALQPPGLRPYIRRLRLIGLLCAVAVGAIYRWEGGFAPHDPLAETIGYSAVALGCMGVIGLATRPQTESVLTRVMSLRPLRFLGRYSYGLYLIHHPAVFLLWKAGVMEKGVGMLPSWLPVGPATLVVQFLIPALVSVSLAMLSWYALEQPLLRLKGRVSYG